MPHLDAVLTRGGTLALPSSRCWFWSFLGACGRFGLLALAFREVFLEVDVAVGQVWIEKPLALLREMPKVVVSHQLNDRMVLFVVLAVRALIILGLVHHLRGFVTRDLDLDRVFRGRLLLGLGFADADSEGLG